MTPQSGMETASIANACMKAVTVGRDDMLEAFKLINFDFKSATKTEQHGGIKSTEPGNMSVKAEMDMPFAMIVMATLFSDFDDIKRSKRRDASSIDRIPLFMLS
ncbi:uncharacterized protein N7477_003377 [Penicillium maclennaniae]|uniref:uncharacterized protein n=1 Tax=Penicillium maclennaniae TaxID=1343394 RepID=UPI0025408117|nr:uncharacterized protein N7477_003377 [Penicillium maclennaniae]KAJ5677744.1 hypothetical protein N7477_003377 [Penicillium maclennaniae]